MFSIESDLCGIPFVPVTLPDGAEFYINSRSCLIHIVTKKGATKFHCGRLISAGYERLRNTPGRFAAKCVSCAQKFEELEEL